MATETRPEPHLYRRGSNRMVWGVCAGLADYFAIDPVILRLGFVLITLAGGAGILLYIILAIVLPVEDGSFVAADSPAQAHNTRHLGALLLIGLGLVLLAGNIGALYGIQMHVLWPMLLVALGIGLIARARQTTP